MHQGHTEALLFTAMGIQSHYRLGANAKSLSKLCVCYLEEHASLQVLTWTWDSKERDHSAETLGPLCGRECRGSPESLFAHFAALVAANEQ